jgi:polyhydroxybutyrate depolymerase
MIKRAGFICLILWTLTVSFSPAHAQTPTPTECDRPAVEAGESEHSLVSRNQERSYTRYVPESYDPTQPTALVIALHGMFGSSEQMRDFTSWNDTADDHNFIVVYPQALYQPDLFVFFPLRENDENAVDDVQFIRDLLIPLRHDFCIDSQRIYVNGFSAGGAMSLLLACRIPEVIAAIGVMAPPYFEDFDDPTWCAPDVPSVPTIALQGMADTVVTYEGSRSFGNMLVGFETWTAAWAARNGCDETPEIIETVETVHGARYVNCDADLVTYAIEDGGHAWAGGEPPPGIEPITDISATELMWEFFEQHPKEEE